MPRDLAELVKEDTLQGMPQLTKSPDELDDVENEQSIMSQEYQSAMLDELSQRNEKRDELHPYTQTLSPSDLESCVRLEEETFPPQERCTREKFQYRLSKCGELSLGIFTSHEGGQIATAEAAAPVYSGAPERKAVLLGHIVGTKTTNPTVTDGDMKMPTSDSPDCGHKEEGRNVCIHSLAVLPGYQGKGLGKTLMTAFLQRMESHGIADRALLLAHEEMVPYYEKLGFENKGKSQSTFGGGVWFDMARELKTDELEMTMEDLG